MIENEQQFDPAYGAIEENTDQLFEEDAEQSKLAGNFGKISLWMKLSLGIPGKEIKPTVESGRAAYTYCTFLMFAIFILNWYLLIWDFSTSSFVTKIVILSQVVTM